MTIDAYSPTLGGQHLLHLRIAQGTQLRGSSRVYRRERTAGSRSPHDEARYRKRHKIENSFARLKDWRRVATRYNRRPKVFLSACALAAAVMFWLSILTFLYLRSAKLAPSPAPARADGWVVRDV